jgi:CheY-like chemotaxis protein
MEPSDQDRPAVILVVEDEMLVRMFALDLLQDEGFHVIEARDGVEALAMLEVRDDVAALLTDVAMPNMDGIALAKIVSERWPHIGIVITSGAIPAGLLQAIEAVIPRRGGSIAIKSIPTIQPGKMHGAGGIAQPLPEPDE